MANKDERHRVRRASSTESECQAVLMVLSETPKEIARIARGRSHQQLHRKPEANAWSPQEIVAHLRACADVWGRSIDRMLAEDHPTICYVSPRTWIKKTDYLQQDFRDSLRAFSHGRATLVETLRGVDTQGWLRRATFTATTLGREATVLSYATRIADHEVRHLGQLHRTVTT
jgi:uncharacterized damage-inducible protein DinB